MFDADNEMNRVIAHFICRDFWLEIECPESAVTASPDVQFWIQIKNTLARKIDNPQVRVAGAQHAVLRRMWKIATQPRCSYSTGRAMYLRNDCSLR
jgi:hypothetical protein